MKSEAPDTEFLSFMETMRGYERFTHNAVRYHEEDLTRLFELARHPADLRPSLAEGAYYMIEGALVDELIETARANCLAKAEGDVSRG